jgi:hypothetical protein
MVKTTVYLDAETALVLKQLARAQDRSQAELIREAIDLYTRRSEPPKPQGIGRFRSGRRDVSERAEELLEEALRAGKWP